MSSLYDMLVASACPFGIAAGLDYFVASSIASSIQGLPIFSMWTPAVNRSLVAGGIAVTAVFACKKLGL